MTTTTLNPSAPQSLEIGGVDLFAALRELPRYGLAFVLLAVGLMKFTAYEANAIAGLVSNSPFLSWTYSIVSPRTLAALIGILELATAALLIVGGRINKAQLIGSALAVGLFATTLSFVFSTPGVFEASLGGFPAISVMPGQFLIKDVVLLVVALRLLGQAYLALRNGNRNAH